VVPAPPPSDWLLPTYSPEGRCQGPIRVCVNQALSPVLAAPRPDRPLMPYRRRITIRRQSGAFAASVAIRDQVVIVKSAAGLLSPTGSVTAVAHIRASRQWTRAGVAKLAGMRRILLGGVAGALLLAVGTRAADALGIGGPRLRCGCTETCWCKRPGLTVFRWVTPGRWHHIGLTADEKRSRHSQA
jgi:hypothetical protein